MRLNEIITQALIEDEDVVSDRSGEWWIWFKAWGLCLVTNRGRKLWLPRRLRQQSFLYDHWYPRFGLLMTSALGFKARVDSLTCMLCHLHTMDSLDSPLVPHLLTSWWVACTWAASIHVLVLEHWWGLSPGSSMLLPHNMWRFTDWAKPLGPIPYKVSESGADPGGARGSGPPLTLGFEAPKLSIFGPYLIFP